MSHFKDLIKDFEPITLDEMDEVKLMSRTDTKFAFSSSKLPQLLSRMLPFYRILNINNKLIHDYKSLYYDTSENKFYLDHHNNINVNISLQISGLLTKEHIDVSIGDKVFKIPTNKLYIKPIQTYTFVSEGISKINNEDIYNCTYRSDIIIHIALHE